MIGGVQFLRSTPLPFLERKLLDGQLKLLEELRTRISLVESILAQLKENDEIVERLKTIPGIGEFFAMLIRHEIDKIERFHTTDMLCAYTWSPLLILPGARLSRQNHQTR